MRMDHVAHDSPLCWFILFVVVFFLRFIALTAAAAGGK
jgi:hypothetical protein